MLAKSERAPKQINLAQAGLDDLPEGWDVMELGELITDQRGVSVGVMYPGNHDPQGIPLIKVGDMLGSTINPHPEFRISPEVHKEYRRTEFQGGELLLTLVGGLGQCAIVPQSMAGWNAARAVAVIRLKDQSDARFLRLCLLSGPLQHLIKAWANTTVQATLNLKEVRQLPVPWPPKKERDTLARIVGSLDDKIELNRRMNETLEALTQTLFKSWFVDATANGLPRGWREASLDEVADFLNGLALQKFPPNGDESLPVIKIAQLRSGNTERADRAAFDVPPDYVVEDGDVLFSWSGSLEVEIWCGGRGALNQHLFKVSSREYPKWFYFLWTRHHLPEFQSIAADKATTMGHIQRKHLTQAKVLVPSLGELDEMSETMSPLIDRLVVNNLESRTLAALRDALLPKLLSGELRVKEAQ